MTASTVVPALVAIAKSEFGAAIAGGLVGALTGAIPSFLLARRTTKEQQELRSEERKDREFGQYFRLYTTLSSIFNSLLSTRQMIEPMINKPFSANDMAPVQRRIKPFAGFGSEHDLVFHADDLAFLTRAGELQLVMDFDLIARRHIAITGAFQDYRHFKEKHAELLLQAESHDISPDGCVTSKVDAKLRPKIVLSEAQLESVIAPTIEMLRENTEFVISICERFSKMAERYFPKGSRVPIMDVSDMRTKYLKTVA